jgi:YD repeat-containing protein
MALATTVETIVDVPRKQAFLGIMPIDLSSIFTGFGPLPAVTGVTDQTGDWDAAGQTRSVTLADGSSAREKLTGYKSPEYFSYTVSGFTGVLRFLTTSADGEWWFETVSEAKTHIKWRYAYNPRNVITVPLLWFIVNVLWRGYMRKALSLSKCQIEKARAEESR